MSNYSIKINLLKIPGVIATKLKGKTTTKKCLIIPIEETNLFVGEKGIYLNLSAIELKERKYEETHFLRQSVDKEIYNQMSEEERKAVPIVGGMKTLEKSIKQMEFNINTDANQAGIDMEDLPF